MMFVVSYAYNSPTGMQPVEIEFDTVSEALMYYNVYAGGASGNNVLNLTLREVSDT